MEDNKLIIYKNSEGNIIVDAIYKDETLWLSQKGMSKVFDVGVPAISKHLKNIFAENELDKNSVVSKMEITAPDEKNYNTEVYSLDAIIAVGYRINSKKATELYRDSNNDVKVSVMLINNDIWLTQNLIAELCGGVGRSTITEHINNI